MTKVYTVAIGHYGVRNCYETFRNFSSMEKAKAYVEEVRYAELEKKPSSFYGERYTYRIFESSLDGDIDFDNTPIYDLFDNSWIPFIEWQVKNDPSMYKDRISTLEKRLRDKKNKIDGTQSEVNELTEKINYLRNFQNVGITATE